MSQDDPASFDSEREGTKTRQAKASCTELGDARANPKAKDLAKKTAGKAKANSSVPYRTSERMTSFWKKIFNKKGWMKIQGFADACLDIYRQFKEYSTPLIERAEAEIKRAEAAKTHAEADEIRSKTDINRAVADRISAETELKQALTKSIHEKSPTKRRIDPKTDIKPSDPFLQQLQEEGVADKVGYDQQGNLVILVTLIKPDEYPPE